MKECRPGLDLLLPPGAKSLTTFQPLVSNVKIHWLEIVLSLDLKVHYFPESFISQ